MRMRNSLMTRAVPVPRIVGHSALAVPARHGYQIIALCHEAHAKLVESAMREEFENSRIQLDSIGSEAHSFRVLARVRAQVRCSNAERSSLVQLVHRLGLMPAVRRIYWESIPGAATTGRDPSAP